MQFCFSSKREWYFNLFYRTLNPKENNKIADKFLEEHKDFEAFNLNLPDSFLRNDFEPLNQHTFFPNRENTDGFFISAFTRVLR